MEDSARSEVLGTEDLTERKEIRGREEFCDIRRMVKFWEEQEVEDATPVMEKVVRRRTCSRKTRWSPRRTV